MAFYVYDKNASQEYQSGDYVLEHNDWNDWWRYENLYTLHYVRDNMTMPVIGQIKIGQITGGEIRTPNLPNRFDRLDPNSFISIGQETRYYSELGKLGPACREQVLTSLNDIAFNLDYFEENRRKDVVTASLLRDISASTVRKQYHRMAHGGVKLTDYQFEYHLPNQNGIVLEAPTLTFSVVPESNPPTNIHVLIGRNGVGKTWLLKNMVNTLYDENAEYGSFTFDGDNRFANIVCLAFSVFDTFDRPRDNDQLKYTFIGVKSLVDGQEVGLDKQFSASLTTCMANANRYHRWKKTIEVLNSDPIFSEINLVECADRIQRNRRDYTRAQAEDEFMRMFNQLSSGHKIVALAITRLVETVEECTLVLLDEPELHLHPPLLAAFTRALSQLLINRNGVAIVTTHSPVILQEVPKSCVWVLRRSGMEMAADRPEIETFGENVGILTSEVFGLEVMESGFHKMLKDVLRKNAGGFDEAVSDFQGQLGAEAIALLRILSLQYGGN